MAVRAPNFPIEDTFTRTSELTGISVPKNAKFMLDGKPWFGAVHAMGNSQNGEEVWYTGVNQTRDSKKLRKIQQEVRADDRFMSRRMPEPKNMEMMPVTTPILSPFDTDEAGRPLVVGATISRREAFNMPRKDVLTVVNPAYMQRYIESLKRPMPMNIPSRPENISPAPFPSEFRTPSRVEDFVRYEIPDLQSGDYMIGSGDFLLPSGSFWAGSTQATIDKPSTPPTPAVTRTAETSPTNLLTEGVAELDSLSPLPPLIGSSKAADKTDFAVPVEGKKATARLEENAEDVLAMYADLKSRGVSDTIAKDRIASFFRVSGPPLKKFLDTNKPNA